MIKILKTNFIFLLEHWRIGAIFHRKRILHRVLGLPSRALDGSPNEIWGSNSHEGCTRSNIREVICPLIVNSRQHHQLEATMRARGIAAAAGARSFDRPGPASLFGGMKLIARSASAVIVRLGFTPGLAETDEPSMTYKPG